MDIENMMLSLGENMIKGEIWIVTIIFFGIVNELKIILYSTLTLSIFQLSML